MSLKEAQVKEGYFKDYELEKRKQDERKVILSVEAPEVTVERIINRYCSKYPSLEFRTFYKLYRLQNFKIESFYYQGTRLNKYTLEAYKSAIRSFSGPKGVFIPGSSFGNKTHEKIYKFISEIQDLIQPFPYMEELKTDQRSNPSITKLINSGVLTDKEQEFVQGTISIEELEQYEQELLKKKEEKIMKKERQTTRKYSEEKTLNAYNIIATNYTTLSVKYIIETLKTHGIDYKMAYVKNLVNASKHFEKGEFNDTIKAYCPNSYKQVWESIHGSIESKKPQSFLKPAPKHIPQRTETCRVKPSTQVAQAAYKAIVKMYQTNTVEQIFEHVHNNICDYSIGSIKRYVSQLKAYDNQNFITKAKMPDMLLTLWKEKNPEQAKAYTQYCLRQCKNVSQPVVNTQPKVEQSIQQTEDDIFAIVSNGSILQQSSNHQWLSGYLAYHNQVNSEKAFLYKLVKMEA